MKRKINSILLMVALATLLISLCMLPIVKFNEPKTLVNTSSLVVVHTGTKTAVYDVVGNNTYNLRHIKVKRTQGKFKPYTAINTDTISITILDKGGYQIMDKTANTIYTFTSRRKYHDKGGCTT